MREIVRSADQGEFFFREEQCLCLGIAEVIPPGNILGKASCKSKKASEHNEDMMGNSNLSIVLYHHAVKQLIDLLDCFIQISNNELGLWFSKTRRHTAAHGIV